MTTGWCTEADSRSATVRATRSSAPPAAVVITSWIGFDGYASCARPGTAADIKPKQNADSATADRAYWIFLVIMLRFRSFSAEYAIDWITRCNHFDLLTG